MTLLVAFAFCGSTFAQVPWADFNDGPYASSTFVIAFVQIDGVYVEGTDNYADLEVASYFLKADGTIEWRGYGMSMDYFPDDGDPHPIIEGAQICYENNGESISFQMYDHSTGTLYENCSIFRAGTPDEPLEILTGDYIYNELYFDYDEAVVLNFSRNEPTTIDLEIIGYNEEGGGWNLISSPVGNVDINLVNNMTINTFDLYYFDQNGDDEGNEWINYKPMGANTADEYTPAFTTLECGKGYLYANSGDVTLQFPDEAYIGEGEFDLDFNAELAENMRGMNLVGNPYNATATVDLPFYRMENDAFIALEGVEINPMEGIIVFAEAEGDKVNFAQSETNGKTSLLALNLSSNSKVIDRAIVSFNEGRTLPKVQFNRNSSKVYITMDNNDYALVRSEGMGEMPVNFKAESNGTYSLNFVAENVEFSYLHLIDNLTGANQDLLANPSYSFEARTTDYATRFRLVFATANNEDSFAFFSNGSLIINNEGNATLQVVDVTGRIVKCENINGSASVNIDAASGVYMVRLVNGDNVKVQKVVK